MPLLELPERCADVGEREGRGDRHVKLAFGDKPGELRKDPGVGWHLIVRMRGFRSG